MKNSSYSWAKALYDLSLENKTTKDYVELSYELITIFSQTEISKVLNNLNIDSKIKKELFDSIEDKTFKHFIYLLIDTKNTKHFTHILKTFIKHYNALNNIKVGTIWTTYKLEASIAKKIKEILEKKTKSKIHLDSKVDKDLIGGIKVDLEDKSFDYSVKKQLENLSLELIKGR